MYTRQALHCYWRALLSKQQCRCCREPPAHVPWHCLSPKAAFCRYLQLSTCRSALTVEQLCPHVDELEAHWRVNAPGSCSHPARDGVLWVKGTQKWTVKALAVGEAGPQGRQATSNLPFRNLVHNSVYVPKNHWELLFGKKGDY